MGTILYSPTMYSLERRAPVISLGLAVVSISVSVAILALVGAFLVPEVRHYFGLDKWSDENTVKNPEPAHPNDASNGRAETERRSPENAVEESASTDPLARLSSMSLPFSHDSYFTAAEAGRANSVSLFLDAGISPYLMRTDNQSHVTGTALAWPFTPHRLTFATYSPCISAMVSISRRPRRIRGTTVLWNRVRT